MNVNKLPVSDKQAETRAVMSRVLSCDGVSCIRVTIVLCHCCCQSLTIDKTRFFCRDSRPRDNFEVVEDRVSILRGKFDSNPVAPAKKVS